MGPAASVYPPIDKETKEQILNGPNDQTSHSGGGFHPDKTGLGSAHMDEHAAGEDAGTASAGVARVETVEEVEREREQQGGEAKE